jgi:hypothetical protein
MASEADCLDVPTRVLNGIGAGDASGGALGHGLLARVSDVR